ncbi:MAG: SUMF1/EgtB/PvdO family nonheme iron enzyme [Planctomycetota bacterium]
MKRHVFICYSHSDLSVAKAVVRQLESRGFVCWAAFRDVDPGQPPLQSFHQALQRSHAGVLIKSPAAENSSEILRQWEWLVVNDRPLFALVAAESNENGPLEDLLKRAILQPLPAKPSPAYWDQLADSFLASQIPAEREPVEIGFAHQALRKLSSPLVATSLLAGILLVAVWSWFVFGNSQAEKDLQIVPLSQIMEQTRDLQRVLNKESMVRVEAPPAEFASRLQNSLGMKFVLIPPGSFTRRSALNPIENYNITLTRAFYLGVTEVTQTQFEDVMGFNPSNHKGDLLPVDSATWFQAVEFCDRLNALPAEVRAGRVYRLPTEAEWEFAARAGSGHRYFFGESPAGIDQFAWYISNSNGKPQDVGIKLPNPWGLYDVLGNVDEWCSDWLAEYPAEGLIDPAGPKEGENKILRGGAYHDEAFRVDSNWRDYVEPQAGRGGIRIVCELVVKAPSPEPSKTDE